jgi:toxin ParE1/3/4
MNLPIRFLPEARDEFDLAADEYEQQRAGLGVDFISRVRDVLDRVSDDPQIRPVIYKGVRKASVARFPFIVLYREDATEILVISIFHTSRNPSAWRSRA